MTLLIFNNSQTVGIKVLPSSVLADIYVVNPIGGSFQATSFQAGRDRIDLSAVGIIRTSFASKIKIVVEATGTLVTITPGNSMGVTTFLLNGVMSGVTENNFIFGVFEQNVVIMQ